MASFFVEVSLKPIGSALLKEKTLRVRELDLTQEVVWAPVNCIVSLVLSFFIPRMALG